MATWIQRQNQWFNQLNICSMQVTLADDNLWHIQYTFDGIHWLTDFQAFATQAAAQTALNTYAASLG